MRKNAFVAGALPQTPAHSVPPAGLMEGHFAVWGNDWLQACYFPLAQGSLGL